VLLLQQSYPFATGQVPHPYGAQPDSYDGSMVAAADEQESFEHSQQSEELSTPARERRRDKDHGYMDRHWPGDG